MPFISRRCTSGPLRFLDIENNQLGRIIAFKLPGLLAALTFYFLRHQEQVRKIRHTLITTYGDVQQLFTGRHCLSHQRCESMSERVRVEVDFSTRLEGENGGQVHNKYCEILTWWYLLSFTCSLNLSSEQSEGQLEREKHENCYFEYRNIGQGSFHRGGVTQHEEGTMVSRPRNAC